MENPATLICVPPGMVSEIWPMVAGMIDAAYAEIDEETPDVERWLIDGHGLLWIAMQNSAPVAALTTSLITKRSGAKVCRMVAAGGHDLKCWKLHHNTIEQYARTEGCYMVSCEGRPGWGRVLSGYETKRICLEKRI